MSSFNGLGNTSNNSTSPQSSLTSTKKNRVRSNSPTAFNPMRRGSYRDYMPPKNTVARPDITFQEVKRRLAKWFQNLPMQQKILLGLMAPGVFSILMLVALQHKLFIREARDSLVKQAKIELAVTEIEYNSKLDQMGVSAQALSENSTIIAAAKNNVEDFSESSEDEEIVKEILRHGILELDIEGVSAQARTEDSFIIAAPTSKDENSSETAADGEIVKEILRQEVLELDIEYATLVDNDLQIIASANADRRGEVFDPDGLASLALQEQRQIKASAIVTWYELARELPPLPEQFNRQNAFIRYTATPVTDPKTDAILGALITGDIVDHKLPIVENTLKVLGGGFSGIYLLTPDGELSLATALAKDDLAKGEQAPAPEINGYANHLSIFQAATDAKGEVITQWIQAAGESFYLMAAKTLMDYNGKPVALLVRGTSKLEQGGRLRNALILQFAFGGVLVLINLVLATVLGRYITHPLKRVQRAAQMFAAGNHWIRSKTFAKDEVGQLALEFNKLADSVERSESMLQAQAKQQGNTPQKTHWLLEAVTRSQARSKQQLAEVFSQTLADAREILEADRLVLYRIGAGGRSCINIESVGWNWSSTLKDKSLKDKIEDPCIPQKILNLYTQGRIAPIPDVLKANLHPDHLRLMEQLQIKALLAAPILHEGQLYGLLIAHHCAKTHEWQLLGRQGCRASSLRPIQRLRLLCHWVRTGR